MNDVLRSILKSKTVTAENGVERPLHAHVDNVEGEFIQAMIGKYRPRVTLEIGCAYGISSLYMCEALRECGGSKHIIIDPTQHRPYGPGLPNCGWEGIGLANLKRAGYSDLIEFYESTSFECLPKLFAKGLKVDLAFLDGQHTFDYVFVDFFYVDKLLSIGGIVIFDDIHYPSIRKVCRYVLTNLPYVSTETKAADGRLRSRAISAFANFGPLGRALRPELRERDSTLGIPNRRFMAVQKKADDLIGEGSNTTRHWTTHNAF